MRLVLGIIVGVLVGAITVGLVEAAGHLLFSPPSGLDLKDPEVLKSVMHEIPFAAKAAVLVAWGLGVLAGGITARIISNRVAPSGWAVAAILFAGAAYTMTQIPHPLWMVVGAVLVTIVGALGAATLTPRRDGH